MYALHLPLYLTIDEVYELYQGVVFGGEGGGGQGGEAGADGGDEVVIGVVGGDLGLEMGAEGAFGEVVEEVVVGTLHEREHVVGRNAGQAIDAEKRQQHLGLLVYRDIDLVLALRLKPGPQTVFGQGGKVSDTGNGLHTVVLRRIFLEDPGVAPQTEYTHRLAVGLRQKGQQRRVAK